MPKDQNKQKERLRRLKDIRKKATEAEDDNRREVFAEYERKATSAKQEIYKGRKYKEARELLERQEAEERGIDYDRTQLLRFTAQEVDDWNERQKDKASRVNTGFGDFAEANLRKHVKLVDKIRPDLQEYSEMKAINSQLSSSQLLYRTADSIEYGDTVDNKPSQQAIDNMADDIRRQQEVRRQHSRLRAEDLDGNVSYINDKNMRFNRKITKVYDEYAEEIRENLERGTAL